MGRLDNKVAVITGASNGMGAAEARIFTKEGARVVLADLDQERGAGIAAELSGNGFQAAFVKADATSEDGWRAIVDLTTTLHGKADILINNVGLASSAFAPDFDSTAAWTKFMELNALSAFLGTRSFAPIMRDAGGGSIINISSIAGLVGSAEGHPAYGASKGAVRQYSKAAAIRYGKWKVRVNCIIPGVMTPMQSSKMSSGRREHVINNTPLGRTGESIDVAYAALFLASDEASFITASELVVDGGFTSQ